MPGPTDHVKQGLYKASVLKQMERLCVLWPVIEKQSEPVSGGAIFEWPIKSSKLKQLS
jgi:hypothetical protein